MKRLILLSLMLYGIAHAQTTGYFRYDTVRFEKVGANSEFVLLNATRGIAGGVLTNIGNGRTAFVLPSTIKTLYTADDSIQGNRTVYIRGGSPNTNSRQLTFNFNTRKPGYPTQTAQYDVQFNQNFGSGPITYFWNYDDSSVNQMGWVNDGGGVNRGNEAGFLLHGSDRQWFANGFQGGFVLRSNKLPVTVSMEGPYPFQVYMKAPSYPTNLTAKPSFWLDSNSKAYLPYLTRLTSTTWLAAYDSANGEVKYIRTDAISTGGGGSAPTGLTVSSSTTLSSPVAGGTTIEVDATGGAVTLTFPSAASNAWLIYRIKKIDASANAFNITTLEGALSITTQYAGYVVQSDGTNWLIIGVF